MRLTGQCLAIYWLLLALISSGCAQMKLPVASLTAGCLLVAVIGAGCANLPQSEDPLARFSESQLIDLGEKYLAAGDTGQALRYLVSVEQRSPNDPVIHYDLGLAYHARALPDKAEEHFLKAIELKPDYAEAQNAVGVLYAQQGRLDQALRYFEQALENPFYRTPQYIYYNMGRIYEQQHDLEKALGYYRRAVRIRANYTPALYQSGKVLEAMKRNDEALQAYTETVHYNPDLVDAQFDYGRLCLAAGRRNEAVDAFQRVIDLAPRTKLAEEAARYLKSAARAR